MDCFALVVAVWLTGVVVATWKIAQQYIETMRMVRGITECIAEAVDGEIEETSKDPWYYTAVRLTAYSAVSLFWPILLTGVACYTVGTSLAALSQSGDE